MFFWHEVEEKIIGEYGCKAINSRGRAIPEEACEIRTCFQRDRDRIIHSKAFRRLKGKTQVFVATDKDHYRTRLTHTLEVAQISRTIARALHLNEDLTEAIALGHDIGHTPFAHIGERTLARLCGDFEHNEHSLRVVDVLEKNGRGLNLSFEVRDGIVNHTGKIRPITLEGQVVKIADRIAYLNHDLQDSIASGVILPSQIPPEVTAFLGNTHKARIDTMVKDMILTSSNQPEIKMTSEATEIMMILRQFLFQNAYKPIDQVQFEDKLCADLELLYNYYNENLKALPEGFERNTRGVVDYIAGMTDLYAMNMVAEVKGITRG